MQGKSSTHCTISLAPGLIKYWLLDPTSLSSQLPKEKAAEERTQRSGVAISHHQTPHLLEASAVGETCKSCLV